MGEGHVPVDIGAAERMVDGWEQKILHRAQRYQQMRERVEQISVTETSRDGTVRVTVASNGIPTVLHIAETARERSMAELSTEIMTTLRRAQSRIPELMQQVMAETVGTEDETVRTIMERARQQFPEPPANEPGAAPGPASSTSFPTGPGQRPTPPRRPGPTDGEDDYGDESYLH